MDGIELSIFASRIDAICDEMGAVLRRSSFSPNIRDRLDFSCAIFDPSGELCAQAAHIPVHLGSMAYAMRGLVSRIDWAPGDMMIVNDPFLGGTHLPDVTLVAPVFNQHLLAGFAANRAHHADIGSPSPGSMPLSRSLDQEGIVIPPALLIRGGFLDDDFLGSIVGATSNPREARGDFAAQISANRAGVQRLSTLIESMGLPTYLRALEELQDYGERLARSALAAIPDGSYPFCDYMDDDGQGTRDIPIRVLLTKHDSDARVDFSGTAAQVPGNINCPLSVAAAAVYYAFRCLMPPQTPACAGSFRPIELSAPEGCLLNALRPAAVAAGNVETSTRVVDVVLGALAQAVPDQIPAASHGSMNNVAMGARGSDAWDYYETIGGGMGAGPRGGGQGGVQTHMTNTLNTPIEVLELQFPVRITRYELRRGSGGSGISRGGDGLIREFRFSRPASVTVLSERRRHSPWGVQGGASGAAGQNLLDGRLLEAKVSIEVQAGQTLTIKTPGGGGCGVADREEL